MQSSDISSRAGTPGDQASVPQPRERHALSGRSHRIDPRTDAVRRDLADIRLADRVFAPHYAAAMPCSVVAASPLRTERDPASAEIGQLAVGEMFEVLDITGGDAWGIAAASGLVGYVDAAVLDMAG